MGYPQKIRLKVSLKSHQTTRTMREAVVCRTPRSCAPAPTASASWGLDAQRSTKLLSWVPAGPAHNIPRCWTSPAETTPGTDPSLSRRRAGSGRQRRNQNAPSRRTPSDPRSGRRRRTGRGFFPPYPTRAHGTRPPPRAGQGSMRVMRLLAQGHRQPPQRFCDTQDAVRARRASSRYHATMPSHELDAHDGSSLSTGCLDVLAALHGR